MQKKWIVLLAFGLIINSAVACDLCTVYLGIQPNDFKSSFTLRHRYRLFQSDYINQANFTTRVNNQRIKGKINDKHGGEATDAIGNGERFTYAESYNSYDVVLNFYLSNKWQLNSSINFSDNYIKQNDSIIDNVAGIGDLKVLAKYTLYNSAFTEDTTNNRLIHRVNIGGGVSLPTGKYNKYSVVGFVTEFTTTNIIGSPEMELDPHLQAGTGSYGFIGIIEYMVKYEIVGFNSNFSYQFNTTNNNNFRLSNRLNANGSLFFIAKLNDKIKLMPNLGIAYEMSDYDLIDGEDFIDSGGEAVFLNQGINAYINKLGLTFNYYIPAIQKLHGIQPLNNRRLITQLTYYF